MCKPFFSCFQSKKLHAKNEEVSSVLSWIMKTRVKVALCGGAAPYIFFLLFYAFDVPFRWEGIAFKATFLILCPDFYFSHSFTHLILSMNCTLVWCLVQYSKEDFKEIALPQKCCFLKFSDLSKNTWLKIIYQEMWSYIYYYFTNGKNSYKICKPTLYAFALDLKFLVWDTFFWQFDQ